jgi:hypothetical protein
MLFAHLILHLPRIVMPSTQPKKMVSSDELRIESQMLRQQAARLQKEARLQWEEIIRTIRGIRNTDRAKSHF